MNPRLFLVAVAALGALSAPALAFRSGPPIGRNGSVASGGNTCRLCHLGDPPVAGMVEILGVPAQYEASTVYNITVRVSDPMQVGAGFQMSVERPDGTHIGTMIRSDLVNTRFGSPGPPVWMEHTSTGVTNSVTNWALNGMSASYNLQWQSPAADSGPIIFWAAGNAINNSFTNSGDKIHLANVMTTFDSGEKCLADLDGDGMVGASDLAILLGSWGPNPGSIADLDMSGDVGASDMALMLGSWGPCLAG